MDKKKPPEARNHCHFYTLITGKHLGQVSCQFSIYKSVFRVSFGVFLLLGYPGRTKCLSCNVSKVYIAWTFSAHCAISFEKDQHIELDRCFVCVPATIFCNFFSMTPNTSTLANGQNHDLKVSSPTH